jgi:hypothetical protein
MHGLIFETSVWLLAESTRLLSYPSHMESNLRDQLPGAFRHADSKRQPRSNTATGQNGTFVQSNTQPRLIKLWDRISSSQQARHSVSKNNALLQIAFRIQPDQSHNRHMSRTTPPQLLPLATLFFTPYLPNLLRYHWWVSCFFHPSAHLGATKLIAICSHSATINQRALVSPTK